MTEHDATFTAAAAPERGTAADPIADGVVRQLDPNTIHVERMASWIFSAIVGVLLLIQLVASLFSGPWRIASSLALTVAVSGFLVWLSHWWPEISYRHTSYRVDPQGIEIRRGVIWRRTINVPKSRVQHIDVSQGPLQRRYALGTLVIYTAGTVHAKVELRGLSHARAMRIRDHLLPSSGDDAV